MVTDAPSPWNIANIVTMIRIAMVPFFAWALLVEGGDDTTWRLVATAIFVVAAVSDKVDGYLARSRGLITDLGKLLDPIADKLLVGTALILLWIPLGELPWWIPVIILVRELGITFMRMGMLKYEVMPASRGGKLKTVLQLSAIAWYLWPFPQPWASIGPWLMGAALVVTVVTGIDYVARAVRLRRGVPKLSA